MIISHCPIVMSIIKSANKNYEHAKIHLCSIYQNFKVLIKHLYLSIQQSQTPKQALKSFIILTPGIQSQPSLFNPALQHQDYTLVFQTNFYKNVYFTMLYLNFDYITNENPNFGFITKACYQKEDERKSKNLFMQKIKTLFASAVMNYSFFCTKSLKHFFFRRKISYSFLFSFIAHRIEDFYYFNFNFGQINFF